MKFTVRYGGMVDVTSMTDDKQVFLRDPDLPWRDFITVQMSSYREGREAALEIARSLRREFNVATAIKAERSGEEWSDILDLMGDRDWRMGELARHLNANGVRVGVQALAEILHGIQVMTGDVQTKYVKSAPGDMFPETLWFASRDFEEEVTDAPSEQAVEGNAPGR